MTTTTTTTAIGNEHSVAELFNIRKEVSGVFNDHWNGSLLLLQQQMSTACCRLCRSTGTEAVAMGSTRVKYECTRDDGSVKRVDEQVHLCSNCLPIGPSLTLESSGNAVDSLLAKLLATGKNAEIAVPEHLDNYADVLSFHTGVATASAIARQRSDLTLAAKLNKFLLHEAAYHYNALLRKANLAGEVIQQHHMAATGTVVALLNLVATMLGYSSDAEKKAARKLYSQRVRDQLALVASPSVELIKSYRRTLRRVLDSIKNSTLPAHGIENLNELFSLAKQLGRTVDKVLF
jgi:hypothetical protein